MSCPHRASGFITDFDKGSVNTSESYVAVVQWKDQTVGGEGYDLGFWRVERERLALLSPSVDGCHGVVGQPALVRHQPDEQVSAVL